MLPNIKLNIILLIASGILSFVCAVDLQNYIIREDSMYRSSVSSGLFYFALIFLTYVLNGIAVYLEDFAFSRFITCSVGLLFAAWYFSSGYLLYINKNVRILLLLLVCSIISIGYIAMESFFIAKTNFD